VAGARAIMTSLMFSESSWSMFHGFRLAFPHENRGYLDV